MEKYMLIFLLTLVLSAETEYHSFARHRGIQEYADSFINALESFLNTPTICEYISSRRIEILMSDIKDNEYTEGFSIIRSILVTEKYYYMDKCTEKIRDFESNFEFYAKQIQSINKLDESFIKSYNDCRSALWKEDYFGAGIKFAEVLESIDSMRKKLELKLFLEELY